MNGRKSRVLLFGLLAFTAYLEVVAQPISADNAYIFEQWTVENGLPVNNVVDIIQSADGYLWLATFDGLVRFDGVRFKVFQKETHPGMQTNRITKVIEGEHNVFWLITEQDYLLRFSKGSFERIGTKQGVASDYVLDIAKDSHGDLWIGTTQGISTFRDGQFSAYKPELIKAEVNHLFITTSGEVWFTNKNRTLLFRHGNEGYEQLPVSAGMANISKLTEFNGAVWFGANGVVYTYNASGLQTHSVIAPVTRSIADIRVDNQNQLWAYSALGGLFCYSNNTWAHLKGSGDTKYLIFNNAFTSAGNNFFAVTTNGVWVNGKQILAVSDGIYSNLFDKEGNLWIGTTSNGLIRLRKNPFKTISVEEGLPYKNVYSVAEGDSGTMYVGTYGGGVATINADTVTQTLRVGTSSTGGVMLGMLKAKKGTMYVSSLGTSVLEITPGERVIRASPFSREKLHTNIGAMYEDENDTLWIGAFNGLFKYNEGSFFEIGENERYKQNKIRFFEKGPDSTLWMASDGVGFVGYKQGEITEYGQIQGFPSNLVRSLYIEPKSTPNEYVLWVGTQDIGLLRVPIENGEPLLDSVTKYGTSEGLLDYVIHIILEDNDQNFWLNTNRGIFRIAKQELEAFHRGEIDKVSGVSYTEKDGLRNREGNGGVQPAGIKAADGRMWLANQDGVIVFDPEEIVRGDSANIPTVVIEETVVAGEVRSLKNGVLNLQKEERDFELYFTVLSLVSPEKNRLKYRLVGFNDEWQVANGRRSAVYTNIPAGWYTFEVMGANYSGIWNPNPVQVSIIIAPHFYETSWFKGLLVLGGVWAFFLGLQWRVKALKMRQLKLEKLVVERTTELEEKKKLTEQQAERLKELDQTKTRFFTNISHELRTPLTLIMSPLQKLMSDSDKYDAESTKEFKRMFLNSIRLQRLIDQTLDLSRLEQGKAKLHVQELDVVAFLEMLVDLFQNVAADKEIKIRFESRFHEKLVFADPDKLDKMVANLISNAIKFTPSGGLIRVVLDEDDPTISISVIDSGIGISPEHSERIFERFFQVDELETRHQEGSGIGLSLARDFAQLHRGELTVSSQLEKGSNFTLTIKKGSSHFSKAELTNSQIAIMHEFTNTTEHKTEAPKEQPNYDSKTILVVEDNTDLRDFISGLFTDAYEVLKADHGISGLEKATEALPDLIIADIMMPEMDGLTFNTKLKENGATASIPVIFLTAKATQQDKIQGLEAGGDDYITKPFDPALLQVRAKNLIKSRYRLRELLQKEFVDEVSERVEDPFLAKVNEVLSKNFMDQNFNIKKMSEALHLDRTQVLRKIKELTGLTPTDYLKQFRMARAKEMLERHAGNISEIAYATGYSSLSYFSFSFKEYVGVSPSEFLAQKYKQ